MYQGTAIVQATDAAARTGTAVVRVCDSLSDIQAVFERPAFIVTVHTPVVEGPWRALSAIPWVLASDVRGQAVRWVVRCRVLFLVLSN